MSWLVVSLLCALFGIAAGFGLALGMEWLADRALDD